MGRRPALGKETSTSSEQARVSLRLPRAAAALAPNRIQEAVERAVVHAPPACVQTTGTPKQRRLLRHLAESGISTLLLLGESTFTQMASHLHCALGGKLRHYRTLFTINASVPANAPDAEIWRTAVAGSQSPAHRLNIGATQLQAPGITLTLWYALVYSFSASDERGVGCGDALAGGCLTPRSLAFLLRSFGEPGTLRLVSPPGLHYHDANTFDTMARGMAATAWKQHAQERSSAHKRSAHTLRPVIFVDSAPQYFHTVDGSGLYEQPVRLSSRCVRPSNATRGLWRSAALARAWELQRKEQALHLGDGEATPRLVLTASARLQRTSDETIHAMKGDCTHTPASDAGWLPLVEAVLRPESGLPDHSSIKLRTP